MDGFLSHSMEPVRVLDKVATRRYIQTVKTMGVRELKNRLSEVVRAVKAGEHVLVTDRGTVVAELVPPRPPPLRSQRPGGACSSGGARMVRVRCGQRSQPVCGTGSAAAAADVGRASVGRGARNVVTLYAESSAPLAWLLEQQHGARMADALASADLVVASELTLIECDRVLIRAVVLGEVHEADLVDRQSFSE